MMNKLARFALLVGAAALAAGACVAEDDGTDSDPSGLDCTTLAQAGCSAQVSCTWTGAACVPGASDASECTLPACPAPKCGQVWVDGGLVCIARPNCEALSEAVCTATLGCRSVVGRLPESPVGGGLKFVGCGDGIDSPGSMIWCTASGPDADCWVLPDTGVPTGWKGWPCGDPKTHAECMAQGPYAGD